MAANHEMREAPGEALHPSIALANSRRNSPSGPMDELASLASLRAWLDAHGFVARRGCNAADAAAFRDLREAIRELFHARIEGRPPDPAAVEVVNGAAATVPTAPRLEWTRSGPVEVRDYPQARGLVLDRALIAADAIELIVGPEHTGLCACSAPGCVRLLLRDHPRRVWCSTRCGDRVRASRYYHRHRSR